MKVFIYLLVDVHTCAHMSIHVGKFSKPHTCKIGHIYIQLMFSCSTENNYIVPIYSCTDQPAVCGACMSVILCTYFPLLGGCNVYCALINVPNHL